MNAAAVVTEWDGVDPWKAPRMPRKVEPSWPPQTGQAPTDPVEQPVLLHALQTILARGVDFTDVEIRCLCETPDPERAEYGFVRVSEPGVIYLLNTKILWETKHLAQNLKQLAEGVDIGQLTAGLADRLRDHLPFAYADRLAENLEHEYTHLLTLKITGDYNAEGFDWLQVMPEPLYGRITETLSKSRRPVTAKMVGEVIAEDGRRYLGGNYSRVSPYTFRRDMPNLDAANERAKEVWSWLTNTDPR